MIELIGRHGKDCKIYVDDPEEDVIQFLYKVLDNDISQDIPIRVMPDCHSGTGCIVGLTLPTETKVNPEYIGCDIGCLDCDTEVLTPTGWRKISDWKNEEILQFDPDTDTGRFIKPKLFIKKSCDWFYHYKKSGCGLDQMVSEEHNLLVYVGKWGNPSTYKKLSPKELNSCKSIKNGYYRFKTCFNISQDGIDLSDDLIKVDIMTQADGYIESTEGDINKIKLHLKKERKIQRAEELLSKAGIEYKILRYPSGTTDIIYEVDKNINKDLTKYYTASLDQLKIVCNECLLWDGHDGDKSYYSSTSKSNSDVIQFAFIATNIRASINTRSYQKKNWKDCNYVIPSKNKFVGYSVSPEIVKSKDGFKYCFYTTTGYFLCRRNGYTFITGNCGVVTFISKTAIPDSPDLAKIDYKIRNLIPMGMEINEKPIVDEKEFYRYLRTEYSKARSAWPEVIPDVGEIGEKYLRDMLRRLGMDQGVFYKSLGTLGGGEDN